MVARIAVAVAALAVVAALTIELRAHDLLANATQVAGQAKPSKSDVDAQLDNARTLEGLRPGSQPFLAAASLNLRIGRYAAAERAATSATRREPENFSAWVTLAVARGLAGDNAGRRAAFARAHALNPLYPIPH